MPRVHRRRRLPAMALVAVVGLTTIATARPVAAEPLASRMAAPVVHVQADRSVKPNEPVRVLVMRLSAARPVTIAWGDGTRTRVRSGCSARWAARHPRICGSTVQHAYAKSGAFRIVVTRNPAASYRANLRVAAPTPPSAAPWRGEMLAQVNSVRQQAGVSPVELCSNLTAAAQDYATLMASTDYYGHVGPDGSQPWDRMSAQGYSWRAAAENIAAGFDTTSDVMAGWRASAGHYANLVNPTYTHIGFGRATDAASTYKSYWVQEFGAGGTCTP